MSNVDDAISCLNDLKKKTKNENDKKKMEKKLNELKDLKKHGF